MVTNEENEEHKIYTLSDWVVIHEAIPSADAPTLRELWAETQAHKYDGLLTGEEGHEFIFRQVELPIINRLYPEDMLKGYVHKWVSYLYNRAKKEKTENSFESLRKSGIPFKKAREHLPGQKWSKLVDKYSQPYKFVCRWSSGEADALFQLGLERYVKLFYDRFHVPVQGRKGTPDRRYDPQGTLREEE